MEDQVMSFSLKQNVATLALCGALGIVTSPLHAQTTDIGTLPAGTVCGTRGVNNAYTIIGECISSHASGGHRTAIVERISDPVPAALQALVSGKRCNVGSIGDNGVISGLCENSSKTKKAVRWTLSNDSYNTPPVELLPFQGLLGIGADVDAVPGPVNAQGVIAGISINSAGHRQAVYWPAGSTTPTQLPNPPAALLVGAVEGCAPSAINNASTPTIVGSCAVDNAGVTTNVAVRWTASGGAYTATPLGDLGEGYCTAVADNLNGDAVGACENSSGDPQAVLWAAGSTSAVTVLVADESLAVGINDLGVVTGDFLTSGGYEHVFVGNPRTAPVTDIGVLTGGHNCQATGIDDNGDVGLNCDNATSRSQASFFKATTGTLVQVASTTSTSSVSAISHNGALAGGYITSDQHPHGFRDNVPVPVTPETVLAPVAASAQKLGVQANASIGYVRGLGLSASSAEAGAGYSSASGIAAESGGLASSSAEGVGYGAGDGLYSNVGYGSSSGLATSSAYSAYGASSSSYYYGGGASAYP
jgi:hypothetical protein